MARAVLQLMIVILVTTGFIYIFTMLGTSESLEEGEVDIRIPRAPASASNVQNPLSHTPETIAKGQEIFQGKGTCFTCHGTTGRGDGPAGLELRPKPRDFTNPKFHEMRTDGELFWVIQNGTTGTRMFSYSPSIITEEEAWAVIYYIRTLAQSDQRERQPADQSRNKAG